VSEISDIRVQCQQIRIASSTTPAGSLSVPTPNVRYGRIAKLNSCLHQCTKTYTLRHQEPGTRLARDRLWDDTPGSEGRGASEGPQPVALRRAGYTAAHLRCCEDEPEAPEVTGATRETPVKSLRGIKGCSSEKVTQPTAQLKRLYTNAHSVGDKQEELEATVHQY